MNENKIKVLYIFAGKRKELKKQWQAGEMPDTYFIGLNHLKEFGIEAEYIENKLMYFLRQIHFNLTNLALIFKIRKYDIVFTGASLLIVFLVKVVFRFSRPKFVFYNTFLTNLYQRNNSGFKRWLVRKIISSIDAIACPSRAQQQFLIQQGFDPNKIFYIRNGIDIDFIQTNLKKVVDQPKERYILSVGKDLGRDYKTLVEAVKDLNIKVKVVAWPRNFQGIDKLPANISVQALSYRQVLALYKNAEFVVLPTKKEGNFNASDCSGQYSLLDAMASGKAVIASQRATLPDYLTDGVEGIIVEAENPTALKLVIKKLLGDSALAEQMGENALVKVKKFFTTKILAKNLANLFLKIAEEK